MSHLQRLLLYVTTRKQRSKEGDWIQFDRAMNTRRVLARCCGGEMRMSVVMKRADLILRGFLFRAVVTICFGVFILLATIDSIRIHLSNGSLEMVKYTFVMLFTVIR